MTIALFNLVSNHFRISCSLTLEAPSILPGEPMQTYLYVLIKLGTISSMWVRSIVSHFFYTQYEKLMESLVAVKIIEINVDEMY